MKKALLILLILPLAQSFVVGQAARTTPPQYIFNTLTINPAYAGSQYVTSMDINYFGSAQEFDFLYQSVDFSLHGPVSLNGRNNIGLQFKFLREGGINEIKFRPSFAYRITTDVGKIAFGGTLAVRMPRFRRSKTYSKKSLRRAPRSTSHPKVCPTLHGHRKPMVVFQAIL